MLKRITSILLSGAVVISAISTSLLLPIKAESAFTAQHMSVDFNSYNINLEANKNNVLPIDGSRALSLWDIKTEGADDYLECKKTYSFTSADAGYYSFILNPTGLAGEAKKSGSTITKNDKIFCVEEGARYRVTFRYKMPSVSTGKEVCLMLGASSKGYIGYGATGSVSEDGKIPYSNGQYSRYEFISPVDGTYALEATNDWKTVTAEFQFGSGASWGNAVEWVDSLQVGFVPVDQSSRKISGYSAYTISVDDFVIDRLGSAKIIEDGSESLVYGVPVCSTEYKDGFGTCEAESIAFNTEKYDGYSDGKYTAFAERTELYTDSGCTVKAVDPKFDVNQKTFYSKGSFTTSGIKNQVAFCGFDEWNLRRKLDYTEDGNTVSTDSKSYSYTKYKTLNNNITVDDSVSYTGSKSLHIDHSDGAWGGKQFIYIGNGYELVPGKSYNISMRVKRDAAKDGGTGLNIGFYYGMDPYTNTWITNATISASNFKDDWQEVKMQVSIPSAKKLASDTWTAPYGCYMAPALAVDSKNGKAAYWLDTITISEIVDDGYWTGAVAGGYHAGTGSKEDPYQISNAQELALLCKTVSESKWGKYEESTKGKYYVLTDDIKINDTSLPNWKQSAKEWYSAAKGAPAFKGVFDGQGHTISGLYINNETDKSVGGLFIRIGKGAVVKNLGIENSYIAAAQSAGAIAGEILAEGDNDDPDAAAARVVACYADESVTVESGAYAGGIVGTCSKSMEFRYCYFTGSVKGKSASGGLLGGNWGSDGTVTYRSCYSAPSNDESIAGGKAKAVYSSNTYATKNSKSIPDVKVLSRDKMLGSNASDNMTTLDFNQVWIVSSSSTPTLRVFENGYSGLDPDSIKDAYEEDFYDAPASGMIWSGKIAENYYAGTGTKEDPYQIATAEELAKLCKAVKNSVWGEYDKTTKGKYFVLTSDIILNDTSSANWTESANEWFSAVGGTGAFKGVIDGKGHTVKGLYISNSEENSTSALLLRAAKGAVIKNIGIENSYIKATKAAGAVVGEILFENLSDDPNAEMPKIIACYAGEDVTVDGVSGYAGGIVGCCARFLELRYCYFTGTVLSTKVAKVGGLVGSNWGGADKDDKSNIGAVTYRSCYSAPKNGQNLTGNKSSATKATNTYTVSNTIGEKTVFPGLSLLAVERMTGSEALQYMKKLDYSQVWRIVDGRTPALRVFEDGFNGTDPELVEDAYEVQIYDGANPGDIWTGKISSKYASGTGTKEDPYIIETAEEMARLAYEVNNSSWDKYATEDKYYKLASDIFLNDTSAENWYENPNRKSWFTAFGQDQAFCGHLDGSGYVVYGLCFSDGNDAKLTALFPSAGRKSIVENLGIATSHIVSDGNYAGAFYAYVENRNFDKNSPIIRNCFVAEDVFIEGSITGGFVAALPSTVSVKDSYFLGKFGENCIMNRTGGIFGSSWYVGIYSYSDSDEPIKISVENVFVCNEDRNHIIGTKSNYANINSKNAFALKGQEGIATFMGFSNMTGDKAKERLTGFDFDNNWMTVDKSTPLIKIFDKPCHDISKFVRLKGPVTISFETYGGNEVASVSGDSGSKLVLPTPVRNKDIFDGWFVYPLKTWDVPFSYDFFPDDDITLYAKWIEMGISQDFESYSYTPDEDGLEEGYEVFKPGALGYNAEYVKGGIASLHRLNTVDVYKNACISGSKDSKLTPGTEYEISMYVWLKDRPKSDDKLMLAYTQYADWAFDENATQVLGNLSDISTGSWQYVTYKFVAYSEYVALRLPAVEMYIDDIYILSTDRTNLKSDAVKSVAKTVTTVVDIENDDTADDNHSDNNSKKVKKKIIKRIIKKNGNADSTNYTVYFIIAGAVILAGATVTAVLVIKKKRNRFKI